MSTDDDPTMEHPLVAAVRAVACLAEQRDLLVYLLYVAVYEMHPTFERRGQRDPQPDVKDPYPCGFNFPHGDDASTVHAMTTIIAERWRKDQDARIDFLQHGADLLARWRKACEQ